MKSTTIFLIALVAVSVTAISLRREEPVMAPVESGPVVDDVVGSDPTTWGPMGPPMKDDVVGSDPTTWGPMGPPMK